MKDSKIASRYAKALFDLAVEQNLVEQIRNDMDLIFNTCKSSKDLVLMLKSPVVRFDRKQKVIHALFDNKVNKVTMSYTDIIIKKGREKYLMEIAGFFIDFYKSYKGIVTVQVQSAEPLEEAIKNKIISLISGQTKGTVELVEEINPALIGGFILTYDNKQYDATILNQLNKLAREFEKNLYVRAF